MACGESRVPGTHSQKIYSLSPRNASSIGEPDKEEKHLSFKGDQIMRDFLKKLGIRETNSGAFDGQWLEPSGPEITSYTPITDEPIAKVISSTAKECERAIRRAQEAFRHWCMIPGPKRGEIVRQISMRLRDNKSSLSQLIALEAGKTIAESEGEVQEMIDMADFVVGLSRQLYGVTMQSERPNHRLYEHWLPLGPIGIITSFNFPLAVFSWNALVGLVAGDTLVWKPSSSTPLCSIAAVRLFDQVLKENGMPDGIISLLIGGGESIGEALLADRRLPLISATGSCQLGRRVAEVVGKRLGRTLLELGGNNGVILLNDADLSLALKSILFASVGTSGQRCTTLRRLIVQDGVYDRLVASIVDAYEKIRIGDPFDPKTLMGPLIDQNAVEVYKAVIKRVPHEGGEILWGGEVLRDGIYSKGCWVKPTLVAAHKEMPLTKEENFVPVLYIIKVRDYEEAIDIHNNVDQGLSSGIFTTNLSVAERFLSPLGSDCGIANVNIATSGAELGGAFGGEKDTGGGREAGSDAWKFYMRRQTVTINWGKDLPLAQGIKFGDFSS